MSDERLRFVTAAGLVIGALLGMASALARDAPPPERQGAAGGRLLGLSGGRDADRLGLRDEPRGERALVRCGCRLVSGSPRPHQRGAGVPGARQSDGCHCGRAVRDRSSADVPRGAPNGAIGPAAIRRLSFPGHHPARLGLGAPQDATGAERCAVSVEPVDRMFATPPDSPGQCEPGLSDDRPRDPRLCYCPELSPRATRSSSS